MHRRAFLRHLAVLSGMTMLPLGKTAWAAVGVPDNGPRRPLVVIFLRGAIDGLNVVVPYTDRDYHLARPSIAIPPPGSVDGAIDLDGRFGLHPALASLAPLWRERSLAFVHACGSPDPTRSHFDAQDYMESGTPGIKTTSDGWLNRLLAILPGPRKPTAAINVGATLPRILRGPLPVAELPLGKNAARPMPLDRPIISSAFDRLYDADDALSRAYREGQAARQELMRDLAQDMMAADNGAPSPRGFAEDAQHLARLIAADPNVRLAFVALGGWDTHINQGAATGQLANHLHPLGEGLLTLARELGPLYANTTMLVMSEFGRTVNENGNGGTDHGHGNVMWLLGGRVRGGQVYGAWPGLANEDLYERRDLPVTTDFREVIAAVLTESLGLHRVQLGHVLPRWSGMHRLPPLLA